MAKKKISPVYMLGGAVVLVAVWMQMTTPAPARPKANNRFIAPASSRTKKADSFRPEDYTARFAAVTAAPTNAFKPLIAKRTLVGQLTPLAPNGIPAAFAGGDGNWIYTGNGELDGIPNALLENTSTGETVFVKPGQKWLGMTLVAVNGETITVAGPNGVERKVQIGEAKPATPAAGPAAAAAGAPIAASNAPALPPAGGAALAGPIPASPSAFASPQTSNPLERRGNRRGGRRNNAPSTP